MADVVANSKPPPTVVAYGPAHVIWNLAFALADDGGRNAGWFGGLLIPVAVAFGLWKRSKAAWIVGLLVTGLAMLLGIGHLARGATTLGAIQLAGAAVMLGFLVAPPTRRWVS